MSGLVRRWEPSVRRRTTPIASFLTFGRLDVNSAANSVDIYSDLSSLAKVLDRMRDRNKGWQTIRPRIGLLAAPFTV
jgi:hypothetical protein